MYTEEVWSCGASRAQSVAVENIINKSKRKDWMQTYFVVILFFVATSLLSGSLGGLWLLLSPFCFANGRERADTAGLLLLGLAPPVVVIIEVFVRVLQVRLGGLVGLVISGNAAALLSGFALLVLKIPLFLRIVVGGIDVLDGRLLRALPYVEGCGLGGLGEELGCVIDD